MKTSLFSELCSLLHWMGQRVEGGTADRNRFVSSEGAKQGCDFHLFREPRCCSLASNPGPPSFTRAHKNGGDYGKKNGGKALEC